MNVNSTKILKIFGWFFFLVFFGVSLYFNYLYYKSYIDKKGFIQKNKIDNSKLTHTDFPLMLIGILVKVDSDSIEVKSGTDIKKVQLTPETKYIKTYKDPFAPKVIDINQNELEVNSFVSVFLNKNTGINNPTATKVEMIMQNSYYGEIISIENDKIKMDTNNNIEIKLSESTKYYKIKNINSYDDRSMEDVFKVNPEELAKINFKDIKAGSKAEIFFSDDVSKISDFIAEKVVILE